MTTIVIPVSNQITHNQAALAQVPFIVGPYDRIRIGETDFGWVCGDTLGHTLKPKFGGVEQTFSHADLWRYHDEESLRHDRNWYLPAKAKARIHAGVGQIADLPVKEQKEVLFRFGMCEAFLKMEAAKTTNRSDECMCDALAQIYADYCRKVQASCKREEKPAYEPCPSVRTLRRWLKRLEDCDFEPLALRKSNRHRGPRAGSRLDVEVQAMMTSVAIKEYCSEKRPSVAVCYGLLRERLDASNASRLEAGVEPLDPPSEKTFRRYIGTLSKFMVYAGRFGLAKARKKFKLVAAEMDVVRPGERVEVDEWKMPLIPLFQQTGIWDLLPEDVQAILLAEDKRWWCSVAVDVATRMIMGMKISPNVNGRTNCAVLKMVGMDKGRFADAVGALSPWHHAFTPETVASDGGKGYVNDEYRRRLADLGTTHLVPPGGTPQMRGFIERLNLTMRMRIMSRFKGQTFMDVVQRGDYPAEQRKNALPEEIAAVLVRYLVDGYHNTPHEGLGGETPLEAWKRLTALFGVVPPPSAEKRRHVFGEDIRRKLSPRGIRLMGLYYRAPKLAELFVSRGEVTMDVRFDPDDIGRVSVRIDGDWHGIACSVAGLDGVSAYAWLAAASDLRRNHANAAKISEAIVHEAVRSIGRIAQDAETRAGIAAPLFTTEHILKAEAGILAGFEITLAAAVDNFPPAKSDLRSGIVPVGGSDETRTTTLPEDMSDRGNDDNLWLED